MKIELIEQGRKAIEDAEILADVAEIGPSLERAEADKEKARKQQDELDAENRNGFCPFRPGKWCGGPHCQLWVAWRGMDACAIKALVLVEMRRDGHVNWSEP